MIDNAKKALLHIAKAEARFDDDTYRDFLAKHAGVRSSKDLTPSTFKKVMDAFALETGFVSTTKAKQQQRRKATRSAGARTEEQLWVIRRLYEVRGWSQVARQMGFNKRCCGRSWPQTATHAEKVIEGSKAVALRYVKRIEERHRLLAGGADLHHEFDLARPTDIIKHTEQLHARIVALGGEFSDLQS